jgi:hypothetical protein
MVASHIVFACEIKSLCPIYNENRSKIEKGRKTEKQKNRKTEKQKNQIHGERGEICEDHQPSKPKIRA